MLPLAAAIGLQQVRMKQTIWETSAGYAFRTSSKLSEPMRNFIGLLHEIDSFRDLS
jgi:hypothetical protein